MYGTKDDVDPVRFVIGAATGWGANPPKEALYLNIFPSRNDGSTIFKLHVKGVPSMDFGRSAKFGDTLGGHQNVSRLNVAMDE